ncbi:MAG: DNA-processing protein DprA [Brachymonas sp.]|nr:DNA-processing protein DprA [Brachymonas sp.]
MTREEVAAWLQLVQARGIGSGTARRLLAAFGLPQQILAQSPSALAQLLSAKQIAALRTPDDDTLALIEATWQWLQQGATPASLVGQGDASGAATSAAIASSSAATLAAHAASASAAQSGSAQTPASAQPPQPPSHTHSAGASAQRRLLTLGDPLYPPLLLQMADPPVLLYALGQVDRLQHQQPCIAMVGSRNPTPQGAGNARAFGRAFAEMGWTVVSGLALGVDGAAHEGALQAAEGSRPNAAARQAHARGGLATIAVVGTGLDRVYPRQHHELAHRIVQHGVILSESPLGTPPLSHHFPKRNRIIAGLSQGVLVVEAALQSGSLITARLAGEQGKEVFAIPGSIHAPQSRGCHALIKQGAKLVESAQDVMEELRPMLAAGEQAWMAQAAVDAAAAGPADVHDSSAAGVAAEGDTATAEAALAMPAAGSPSSAASARGSADDPPVQGESGLILQALGHDPAGLDALLARTGMETATLQAKLLELELMGLVGRLPGGLFQRIGVA